MYFVQQDATGQKFIELSANYDDTIDFLLQDAYDNRRLGFTSQDSPQTALLDLLKEKIDELYGDTTFDMEDNIIREAGFDPTDDMAAEQLEYLRDEYPFIPDYEHFLKQDMQVNIMLATDKEKNDVYDVISTQYLAMEDPERLTTRGREDLQAESGLSWLVKQQGYSMADLQKTISELNAFLDTPEAQKLNSFDAQLDVFCENHSRFLASACVELSRQSDSQGVMTVLAKMSVKDFAAFMQPNKELLLPKDATVGIYTPWNGNGGMMEIELEKELVIPSNLLYDCQIEGTKSIHGRNLDQSYGFIGKAWKECRGVQDAQPVLPGRHPSLASRVQNIEASRSQAPTQAPEYSHNGRPAGSIGR